VPLGLFVKQRSVAGLARDAVGILGDDQRDPARLHEVANPVQPRAF